MVVSVKAVQKATFAVVLKYMIHVESSRKIGEYHGPYCVGPLNSRPAATHCGSAPQVTYMHALLSTAGHFHAVLSRGAQWWTHEQKGRAPGAVVTMSNRMGAFAAAGGGISDNVASVAGRGLKGMGGGAGRGSSVWALARSIAAEDVASPAGFASSRKGERGGGAGGMPGGGGAGGGGGVAGGAGSAASAAQAAASGSLDEYHSSPKLKFQLLLREQGVVQALFSAMETVRGLGALSVRALLYQQAYLARPAGRHRLFGGYGCPEPFHAEPTFRESYSYAVLA